MMRFFRAIGHSYAFTRQMKNDCFSRHKDRHASERMCKLRSGIPAIRLTCHLEHSMHASSSEIDFLAAVAVIHDSLLKQLIAEHDMLWKSAPFFVLTFGLILGLDAQSPPPPVCDRTVSGGPQIGVPCALPFAFNGFIYGACTNATDPRGRLWCSTKTHENGTHIGGKGYWGYCDERWDCILEDEVRTCRTYFSYT